MSVYEILKDRDVSTDYDHTRFNTSEYDRYYNPFNYMCGDGCWTKEQRDPGTAKIKLCISDKDDKDLRQQYIDNIDYSDIKTNVAVIWFRPGGRDEEEWYFMGQLTTDQGDELYFFMDAWCDYTGFDCQGYINFTLSRTLQDLCTYGLTDGLREMIRQSTTETEAKN